MFAKVFEQIFDSSIANDYELRHFFVDLLVLADLSGLVDMTPEAIASRTRIPLQKVLVFLGQLSQPDLRSRSPEQHGRRIVLIDEHRDWGWQIVNYLTYRQIASEEQRRENTKMRTRKWRENKDLQIGDAAVMLGDKEYACDAIQKQRQKQRQMYKEGEEKKAAPPPPFLEIHEAWNSLKVVPRCLVVSDKRRQQIVARWRDPFFVSNWRQSMEKVKSSPFCQGSNDRGWRASFDWFLKPDTCAKLMEGKYQTNVPRTHRAYNV